MESQEVLENFTALNGDVIFSYKNGASVENGVDQFVGFEKGKGNLADEVLEDLEEYWEDINDRLTISRMVSDSVIKGMVTAVEQVTAERIAAKEIEVANLKEGLRSCSADTSAFEVIRLPMVQHEYNCRNYGWFPSFTDPCVKHDKMREALHSFSNVAREQFKQVEKEIGYKGGSNSIKKIGSGVELVGLSGILQEKESKCSRHLHKTLDFLKTTVDIICSQVDDVILSSKMSLCEWQQEQDLLGKLEDIVMQSVIKSLQEESEEKLWEQNAQFYGSSYSKWLEKFNDISSLGGQLDAIVKSLSITETGLVSHGSHDLDHLHRRAFSNHVTLPTALCEGNGELEASKTDAPESYDFLQLSHMSKEELVKHFNSIIIEMRRNHESALQQKTEEYFSLKREYLKERGSYVTHRKDEEFDVLRKKIPEVITKLDDFLMENERFPVLINQTDCLVKLKGRLENFLSENHQLRHSLAEKENELKCPEVRVNDNPERLLQHSLTEANMLKLAADQKSLVEDLCIEASLTEEVHKCAMKELIAQMKHNSEDSNMELPIIPKNCDIVLGEASLPARTTSRCEIDDSDIELLILQGLSGLIFREATKDAEEKYKDLYQEILTESEIRHSLQLKVLEREEELKLEFDENERLKEQILILDKAMEQKEKFVTDLSISLAKEKEQFELASQQLSSLKEHANQQQAVFSASNKIRAQLIEAMEQMEVDKVEMHNLIQKLDQTKEELTEAIEKRNIALALAQERHDKLLLHESREEGIKKEMKLVIFNVFELSKKIDDLECRISGTIRKNNLRLEDASSQLISLTEAANVLRRTGLTYRQRLDRRCADLQKAEAEVDLLGDEVDTLLRLLEKIYIALDHYSPILKHYPGIIEILELVRRELSGESIKLLQ